jgi:murein DD-endopeptidase MepM/ murein hydrolase activator NlpD
MPRAVLILVLPVLLGATTASDKPDTPASASAPAPEVRKDVKGLSLRIDTSRAYPGGVLVAQVRAAKAIGPASFVLEGVRCPVYSGPGGLRALVPVPLTTPSGPTTLGFEIRGRRGRRRIPIDIEIAPREFPLRRHAIPEGKRELLERPERVRDSRYVLAAVRQQTTAAYARGALLPPVDVAPEPVFGATETYADATFVTLLTDGLYGDHHRGLDYSVPAGTAVSSPAAGVVTLAQPLAFAGQAVVIDHGRGVVSAFFHLSKIAVSVGDRVEPRTVLGASGDSGIAVTPHLHWGVYVHGIAVDPRVFETIDLG